VGCFDVGHCLGAEGGVAAGYVDGGVVGVEEVGEGEAEAGVAACYEDCLWGVVVVKEEKREGRRTLGI